MSVRNATPAAASRMNTVKTAEEIFNSLTEYITRISGGAQ
jgi:hypothetical protein